MQTITRNQVPFYLQKGSFFETLDSTDDNELFEVPSNCLKPDLEVESDQDLRALLRSVRFWGVYEMPREIFQFIWKNGSKNDHDPLLPEFPEFAPFLSKIFALKTCDPAKATSLAIQSQLPLYVVKFLHVDMGYELNQEAWDAAAQCDDALCMQYLHEQSVSKDTSELCMNLALCGSIKCLRFAHIKGWSLPNTLVDLAARHGHLECVVYLHETCGKRYVKMTMLFAAMSGNLALIRYLHETGCPWEEDVCMILAEDNHLDCLRYAHEKGCPWDRSTCAMAAAVGNLRCLEYAHLQGCSWTRSTISCAVMSNQFDCVLYAHKNGCPMPQDAVYTAVRYRSWRCLWYVWMNRGINQDVLFIKCIIALGCAMLMHITYHGRVDACAWEFIAIAIFATQLIVPAIRMSNLGVTEYWLNIIRVASLLWTHYIIAVYRTCDEDSEGAGRQ